MGEDCGLHLSRSLLTTNLHGAARKHVQNARTVELVLKRLLVVYAPENAVAELRCQVLNLHMRKGQTRATLFKTLLLAHAPFGGTDTGLLAHFVRVVAPSWVANHTVEMFQLSRMLDVHQTTGAAVPAEAILTVLFSADESKTVKAQKPDKGNQPAEGGGQGLKV